MVLQNLTIAILCLIVSVFSQDAKDRQTLSYFSDSWKSKYTAERLSQQPRWVLDVNQPFDGAYDARIYESSTWISSSDDCWTRDQASKEGYVNLIYYNDYGFNSARRVYPMTYPSVIQVDRRNSGIPGTQCPEKNAAWMFLQIQDGETPAQPSNETVQIQQLPRSTFYARSYSGNYVQNCDAAAAELQGFLLRDNRPFIRNLWYCAYYCPGMSPEGVYRPVIEVWMHSQ